MAKKEEHKKEESIAKTGPTAMAVMDYGEDAVTVDSRAVGKGYEHQDKADVSIPIMNLLQSNSPIVTEGKAKAGDWFNSVTEDIFDKDAGFWFVAATTRHLFTEWTPREKGGGFRGQHEIDSDIVKRAIKASTRFGKYLTDDGNQLTETFYVYGALCDETSALSMALVPFWSSKIRGYKAWMTRLRQVVITDPAGRKVRPPLYAHFTKFASQFKKNDKGSFYIPVATSAKGSIIESLLSPDDERFQMAKACMMLVDSGEARVDYSKMNPDEDEGGSNGAESKDGDTSFNFSR